MAVSSCRSALALLLLAASPAWAQVTAEDRAEIVQLALARGSTGATVAPLLQEADRAVQLGLPAAPVVNKIKEGLSKGYPPARVLPVVRDLVGHLQTGRDLVGNGDEDASRTRSMVMLAEALSRGVTRTELDELRTLSAAGGVAPAPERLALGARTWASLKEAGFMPAAALPLVADAVRQGLRDADLLALARDAAARRQLPARPEPSRAERPTVPERPRVERPAAPERPEVQRPERGR